MCEAECNYSNFVSELHCFNCKHERPTLCGLKRKAPAGRATYIPNVSLPPDDEHYYGTYNESLGYPYSSLHFDFNRAHYHNANYDYLVEGAAVLAPGYKRKNYAVPSLDLSKDGNEPPQDGDGRRGNGS